MTIVFIFTSKGIVVISPNTGKILLLFGNPPLGTKILASNPYAGLDWPVRMLVYRDTQGQVWVAWTDFDWIARRHGVTTRGEQFKMATEVAASIATSAAR